MVKKTFLNYLTPIFLLLEGLLWVTIQVPVGEWGYALRFSSILLAFLFALLSIPNRNSIFLVFALFTTVCADFCLVVLNPIERVWGMVFFCVTQTCYFLFLLYTQEKTQIRKANILSRIFLAVFLSCITFWVLKENTDLLAILSVIYFAFLICNIVFSKVGVKKGWLLFVGLICFSLCDIMVGLSVLCELYLEVSETSLLHIITHPPLDVTWLFYVPSQTLISLYCVKKAGYQD